MGELKELIDEASIQEKVANLAKKIEQDYEGKDLTLVGILKGSTVFMVDLARKMKKDVKLGILIVMGIVKACKEEDPELPVVGNLAKNIFGKKIDE